MSEDNCGAGACQFDVTGRRIGKLVISARQRIDCPP